MRSSPYVILILAVLYSVGCSSSRLSIQDEEQAASLYLRSIETGRLYGPFSGEETPPGGTEFQVLLMPRVPKPSDEIDVPISRIIWKAGCGEQPLAIDKLSAIERELATNSFFLRS